MMMMMPRKTMAHIKTDPAAPATEAAQRAKFVKKVHKPPLGVNVINFELNWSPAIPQTPKVHDAVFKFIKNKLHFCTFSSISQKALYKLA